METLSKTHPSSGASPKAPDENTTSKSAKTEDAWLDSIEPQAAEIQHNIYESWLQTLRMARPGITPAELAYENLTYFFPYRFLLTSPFGIPDMDAGVGMMRDFFHNRHKEKLVIYADRDADGISSAAILYLFCIEKMGVEPQHISILLPRQEDKYGITEEAAQRIAAEKPDFLFALDNGSSNRDTLLELSAKLPKLRIAILDHHYIPEDPAAYPEVEAFVNPKRLNPHDPHANLCTAGLSLMFIWALTYSFTAEYGALYRVPTKDGYVTIQNGIIVDNPGDKGAEGAEPEIKEFDLDEEWRRVAESNAEINRVEAVLKDRPEALDEGGRLFALQTLTMKKIMDRIAPYLSLAAMGTVGDLMELSGNNRILVYEGLRQMNHRPEIQPVGVKELMRSNDLIRKAVTEQDFSFTLCPMINAPGRLGDPLIALEALIVTDPLEAAKAVSRLKKENQRRKALSSEAMELLATEGGVEEASELVLAYHPGIHRGISGIVASKLTDTYGKAALVLVEDGDCLRGSIRAATTQNVMSLLIELDPWFIQYGGHLRAAGFSLEAGKKEGFWEAAKEKSVILTQGDGLEEPPSYVWSVKDNHIAPSLWREALRFAPYGNGNPHPALLIEATAPVQALPLGKTGDHARIRFSGIEHPLIEAVWFFHGGQANNEIDHQRFLFCAEPQVSFFMGKSKFQLKITGLIEKEKIPGFAAEKS